MRFDTHATFGLIVGFSACDVVRSDHKAVAVLVAVRFELVCGLLHSPALNESVSL